MDKSTAHHQLTVVKSEVVERAVEEGIERYVQSCKARVPLFVNNHFSVRNAWRLHRKVIGWDLCRTPLNLAWALPSVGGQVLRELTLKVGADGLARHLDKLPKGFETDVQREVNWLIYTELLQLPYQQGSRVFRYNALLAEIMAEPALARQCEIYLDIIHSKMDDPCFKESLENNLSKIAVARTAGSDLAANIVNLAAGYAAFQKTSPGAFAGGAALAGAISHNMAVSSFWLGPKLGAWYYSVYPVTASSGLLFASTGAIMTALAVVSTLSGVVVDPLLAATGVHRKRLEKFIDQLGQELKGQEGSGLNIRDQYLARVFDILDVLKAAAMVARRAGA